MTISLFQELKRGGFHSSISTTYSVDPAFYDSTLQYKLRVYGCRNNILMADQGMLTRALLSTPEAFQKAGLEYVVKGFSHSRSFHPKIFARYGKNKARIIIGSANATCAGWGRNLEAISVFSMKLKSDSQDNDVFRSLTHKTHNYLMSLLEADRNENVAYKLRLLQKEAPWLADYDLDNTSSELSDGSSVDVLFGFPKRSKSLYSQFVSKITDQAIAVSIVSPYWDTDLTTLKNIWNEFGEIPTKIWVNSQDAEMNRSNFPSESMPAEAAVRFFQTPDEVAGRFPHAKIICIHTAKHDHILFGSANCTFAALGNIERPGLNDEACIYRRVPKNTLVNHLELNEDNPVELDVIDPPDETEEDDPSDHRFDPGTMQLFGRKVVWTLSENISLSNAQIYVDGKAYDVRRLSEIQGAVLVDVETVSSTLVAVVELADGRRSRPVIIEAPDMLKKAAPSSIQKGLQDKLNAVISGDADLINLARDFHLIFARDSDDIATPLRHSAKGRTISTDKMGIDYDSPEEFRAALSVSSKLNRQDLAHADNPALQSILKIVLRGLMDFTDDDEQETLRQAEAAALARGDLDDGSDHEDEDDYIEPDVPDDYVAPTQKDWSETISLAQFENNQFYLMKVIDELELQIEELSKNPKKIDPDFITQILFVFYLMMYGCSNVYSLDNGEKQTLIAFGFKNSRDRKNVFLLRAAVMIKNLWGDCWEKTLFRYIGIGQNSETLPIPLYTLIVLSRWILAAIRVEVVNKKEFASLRKILDKQIPAIFESTFCFRVDNKETAKIIVEIQSRVVSDKLFAKRVLLELNNMMQAVDKS